jgi:hypothetical protein
VDRLRIQIELFRKWFSSFKSAQRYRNASFQAYLLPEISDARIDGSLRKLGEKDLYLQTKGNTVLRFAC